MNITPETRIADIASRNPATIRVFQRLGIDFCCGGKRPLGEACSERQVTFAELQRELETAGEPSATELPGADANPGELIRFIVDRYHAELRTELPRLAQIAAKVLDVHGARYPEMADLVNTFRGLYHGLAELEKALHEHIHLENNVLFPRGAKLEEELSIAL